MRTENANRTRGPKFFVFVFYFFQSLPSTLGGLLAMQRMYAACTCIARDQDESARIDFYPLIRNREIATRRSPHITQVKVIGYKSRARAPHHQGVLVVRVGRGTPSSKLGQQFFPQASSNVLSPCSLSNVLLIPRGRVSRVALLLPLNRWPEVGLGRGRCTGSNLLTLLIFERENYPVHTNIM